MKLERKIYETRSQKVGDFLLGIGLFIAINVVFGAVMSFGLGLLSMLFSSASPDGSSNTGVSAFFSLLMTVVYCLPFVVLIVALIYFGMTRYWIALGMLGTIAIGLLLTLLLAAACFGLVALSSGGYK